VLSDEFLAAAAARRRESNFYESKIAPYTLPPLLQFADGRPVAPPPNGSRGAGPSCSRCSANTSTACRRRAPTASRSAPSESDRQALAGAATMKRIAIEFRLGAETFRFHLTLFVPNRRSGPAPVFLLLNHRSPGTTRIRRAACSPSSGRSNTPCRAATRWPPSTSPTKSIRTARAPPPACANFYRRLHPAAAAFTWGDDSRLGLVRLAWRRLPRDRFRHRPPPHRGDRAFAHRQDRPLGRGAGHPVRPRLRQQCRRERTRAGTAQLRGDGGDDHPQLSVLVHTEVRDLRENPSALPVDQHQLVALVAPRGYHGADATEDLHADPRGSWLALVDASRVWALYGRASAWRDEMPFVNQLRVDGPLAYHCARAATP
jgi:hypothetical protein